MHNSITISQLGKLVGLTPKTIRFYEEVGLILPAKRADNGYRIYDFSAVEELKLIKYARNLGLPIEKIKKMLKGCTTGCDHTEEEIHNEINEYLSVLDTRIEELTMLRKRLGKLTRNLTIDMDCSHPRFCCNVLQQLSNKEKGGEDNGKNV